jgi:hypothetical protein
VSRTKDSAIPIPKFIVQRAVSENLSRHSFLTTADGMGAGGEKPPATRLALFIIATI